MAPTGASDDVAPSADREWWSPETPQRRSDMTRSKPITWLATAAVIPLTALAVAGCGGGGNNSTASSAPPKTASGQSAALGVENSKSRQDPRRLERRHPVPVQEGRWQQERLHRSMRQCVATAAGERQADGRQWGERVDGGNVTALRRQAAGHLQRPPGLHLHRRPEPR